MNSPSSPAWRFEDIGLIYSIILGSPASNRISEEYRQQAIEICSSIFESFTVSKVDGFFKGQAEDSMVFQIATSQPAKIDQLAAQLAAFFEQDGVGIVRRFKDSGAAFYSRLLPNQRPDSEGFLVAQTRSQTSAGEFAKYTNKVCNLNGI